MKKVRFETPSKLIMNTIDDYECHSPRPFVEKQYVNIAQNFNQPTPVVFSNDPVQRFENGNCSPYPTANKTYFNCFSKIHDKKSPSSDLDLSILDCSQPKCTSTSPKINGVCGTVDQNAIIPTNLRSNPQQSNTAHRVLTSIENKTNLTSPNILTKTNDFFLRRDNLSKFSYDPFHGQFKQLIYNKENSPLLKKNELIEMRAASTPPSEHYPPVPVETGEHCRCHHCVKPKLPTQQTVMRNINRNVPTLHANTPNTYYSPHSCVTPTYNCSCSCNMNIVQPNQNHTHQSLPQNAVDKKTWAIEKYEKAQAESLDIEKQSKVLKEKREPTVADLFKIIKLQNEQLQLLQEKVDKFISSQEMQDKQKLPIQNYAADQMAVQTVNSEQHKISIGVMTSFEMVRTSTVINKEIVKQCEAQIQCNRSQISIKEVVSKKHSGNTNFLDGIHPIGKNLEMVQTNENFFQCHPKANDANNNIENIVEDKTLNEVSLYNVQVDNAITPLMSPEQSLYLDIRDYSDSDSGSDDQSNVGWTYYNKVMTHVNGMLQDSDMPSSASALYRHTKKKCLQMQTDKSNVSVGKRVTFGEPPLDLNNQNVSSPSDTSLKMNQLAVKYLKNTSTSQTPSPRATGEMSFATKNYMQRHNLLQGQQFGKDVLGQPDIPRFLDITALKQQPKLI